MPATGATRQRASILDSIGVIAPGNRAILVLLDRETSLTASPEEKGRTQSCLDDGRRQNRLPHE